MNTEAAHQAGYEANHEGALLNGNPHETGSALYSAWEAGHLQAQSVCDEWEASFGTATGWGTVHGNGTLDQSGNFTL